MKSPFPPRRRSASWLCALLLTSSSPALADSMTGAYSVRDLGSFWPLRISNAGDVTLSEGPAFNSRVMLYRDGTTTNLTPPPSADQVESGDYPSYRPPVISPGGTIAYTRYSSTEPFTSATTLIAGGRSLDLGTLVPPGVDPTGATQVSGVNDRGEVAGGSLRESSTLAGILSTDRGGGARQTFNLGNLLPVAINNQGIVAGGTIVDMNAGFAHAAIGGVHNGQTWQTDLGTLGGLTSWANAINDTGQVVGASHLPDGPVRTSPDGTSLTPDTVYHAFVTKDGKMVDLGTLPGVNASSMAFGINAAGVIVGQSFGDGFFGSHAFMHRDGVMTDLNSLLPANSGWELRIAQGINDAGQIIGLGRFTDPNSTDPFNMGESRAFLLSVEPVPEPATIVLFAVAGVSLVARHRSLRRSARGRQNG